jgi:hypothetical protein
MVRATAILTAAIGARFGALIDHSITRRVPIFDRRRGGTLSIELSPTTEGAGIGMSIGF